MGGDLLENQAVLLRHCRAALTQLLRERPILGAMGYRCGHARDTLGNLRASLFEFGGETDADT